MMRAVGGVTETRRVEVRLEVVGKTWRARNSNCTRVLIDDMLTAFPVQFNPAFLPLAAF